MRIVALFALTASKRTLIRFNDINISNNMFLNELWDNIIESENKSRINISFQLKGFNNNKKVLKNIYKIQSLTK